MCVLSGGEIIICTNDFTTPYNNKSYKCGEKYKVTGVENDGEHYVVILEDLITTDCFILSNINYNINLKYFKKVDEARMRKINKVLYE